MGRHDLRPLRVHQTANQLLASERISNLPNWHSVTGTIPPAQTLVRTQPLQHIERTRRKAKARRASKLFQPTSIGYEEDSLRRTFFGDHPWELARPRVILENDGKDYEKNDWSRLSQTARPQAALDDYGNKQYDYRRISRVGSGLSGERYHVQDDYAVGST